MKNSTYSEIKYDLVGDIAKGFTITRRSVVKILQGISDSKLYMFRNNPKEFISKIVRLIKEQKATLIVNKITYNTIDGENDSAIFTAKKKS